MKEALVKVIKPDGSSREIEANQGGTCTEAIIANGIMESAMGWKVYHNKEDVSDMAIEKMGNKTLIVSPLPAEGGF